MPPMIMRDTRPRACKFFDLNNNQIATVELAPRRFEEGLRRVVFQGRKFIEGDGTGFYGENEFAEIPAEPKP